MADLNDPAGAAEAAGPSDPGEQAGSIAADKSAGVAETAGPSDPGEQAGSIDADKSAGAADTTDRWKPFRFLLVGGANTVVDFGILFLLVHAGMATVPANMISTGVALTFSFLANRRYTFQFTDASRIRRQIVLFLAVTIFGLWVIQPFVILGVQRAAEAIVRGIPATWALAAGKVVATGVTMVWNYVLYAKVVFR